MALQSQYSFKFNKKRLVFKSEDVREFHSLTLTRDLWEAVKESDIYTESEKTSIGNIPYGTLFNMIKMPVH